MRGEMTTNQDERIFCQDGTACKGRNFTKQKLAPGEKFVCFACQKAPYTVPVINEIQKKMSHVIHAKGDANRFPIRELVQNADDAHASMIVIRVDDDALYFSNNGQAFRPKQDDFNGDWARLLCVLGRPKEGDPESTGAHGSGFQTVYYFTNHPEIYSAGESIRLDPTQPAEDDRVIRLDSDDIPKKRSPYHPKGVLFRFEWRKDAHDGSGQTEAKAIKSPKIWNKTAIDSFAEDLKGYLHDLILCAQRVKTARIIWGGQPGAYEVRRVNFQLDRVVKDTRFSTATVQEGLVEIPLDWEGGFTEEEPRWVENPSGPARTDYLIGSSFVSDKDGNRVYYGVSAKGKEIVTSDRSVIMDDKASESGKRLIHKGNIHVLIPMPSTTDGKAPRESDYYRYSVLPIPYPSGNMFACTAHCAVDEGRRSIILSPSETNGLWFSHIMASIGKLYIGTFEEYLRRIHSSEFQHKDADALQSAVMSAIPGSTLSLWMNPEDVKSSDLEILDDELLDALTCLPILQTGGSWVPPPDAYWAEDDRTVDLIRRLGGSVFERTFVHHKRFLRLRGKLENEKFEQSEFERVWADFTRNNPGQLQIGARLCDSSTLDEETVQRLIGHCLNSGNPRIRNLPVIPDRRGVLRPIENYPVIPEGYEALRGLLRDEKRIHDTFIEIVRAADSRTASANDVIKTLSEEANSQKSRFDNVGDADIELIAQVVSKAVTDNKFALREVAGCRFIPYEHQGRVAIGRPNESNGRLFTETEHAGENYQRHFIFKEQRTEISGLTPEIRRGIRILTLPGVDDEEKTEVEKQLYLVALQEKKIPLNFVRVFVSPSSGNGSLFQDDVLKGFLITESAVKSKIDEKMLLSQKKALLATAKSYFVKSKGGSESGIDRKTMGRVPMLYDSRGEWRPASDFAYDIDKRFHMFGKFELHSDFKDEQEWPKNVLVERLGVCQTLTAEEIADAITRIAGDGSEDASKKLSEICGYLLTSDAELETNTKTPLRSLPEMTDLEWVPTKNGKLSLAGDCLLPTDTNIAALGKDFDQFVELENQMINQINLDRVQERAFKIGIPRKAPTELLLARVQDYYKKSRKPPETIFDELSNEAVTSGYPNGTYGRPVGIPVYYAKGKWWKWDEIRIVDSQDVPTQLANKYLIVREDGSDECSRHIRYLRYFIGVRDAFTDIEILDLMKEGAVTIDMSLWSLLAESKKEGEDIARRYGGLRIFPKPNGGPGHLAPDHMILVGGVFNKIGDWGRWHVIDAASLDPSVTSKLRDLGARDAAGIDITGLKSILESMSWQGRISDDGRYDKMMGIISRIASLPINQQRLPPDVACIPIRRSDGRLECRRLSECYKKDHFKATMFIGKIPIPEAIVDGVYSPTLEAFFEANCGISFSDNLLADPKLEPNEPQSDEGQEIRFHELGKALRTYVRRLESAVGPSLTDLETGIRWLETCRVDRYDTVRVSYRIGGVEESTSGFHIDARDGTVRVNLARVATERIRNELPLEVFNTCMVRRPSEELRNRKDLILGVLTQLLFSDDLRTWTYVVHGYDYGNLNPTMEPLVEILEATDGYLETRSQLRKWYGACQMCMARTPSAETGEESCEKVTSIVSQRGSRYTKRIERYTTGQCLFLCPTHQTLYQRGLVKVPFLEPILHDDYDKSRSLLGEKKTELGRPAGRDELLVQFWDVFKTPVDNGFLSKKSDWGWNMQEIRFRRNHLLQMIQYIEERMEEWQNE